MNSTSNEPPSNKGEGHRGRLREKFLASGLSGFHDYEVVELLLTLGTPRKDCKETAKETLSRFKTLQGVMEASPSALMDVKGVGPTNLFGIKLIKAVAERYLEKKAVDSFTVNNSKALFDYLYVEMRDKSREHFKVVFLNAKNRVISTQTLFVGTLTASVVYPREVVKAALDQHAAAVIFAHNHPSGDPTPSREDTHLTRKLVFSCRVMDVTVHEHLVIGDGRYYSFADQGMIAEMNRSFDALQEHIR
jgi:DNA repair protein RadC